MRISPESEDQQADFSLINVLEYFKMRPAHTDKSMRLTNLANVMGHNRFDSFVKMLLNPVKLVRMVYFARMSDIQDIEVC